MKPQVVILAGLLFLSVAVVYAVAPDGLNSIASLIPDIEALIFPKTIYTITDPYQFGLETPKGWELREMNRWHESELGRPTGEDCASYTITRPDHQTIIYLMPPCGFEEGIPFGCPNDTYIVAEIEQDKFITRYYDASQNRYIYKTAYLMGDWEHNYEDPKPAMNCIESIWLAGMPIEIEVQYFGPPSGKEKALQAADKIIETIH